MGNVLTTRSPLKEVGSIICYSNPLNRYENEMMNMDVLPNVRLSFQKVSDIDAEKPLLELSMSRQLRPSVARLAFRKRYSASMSQMHSVLLAAAIS